MQVHFGIQMWQMWNYNSVDTVHVETEGRVTFVSHHTHTYFYKDQNWKYKNKSLNKMKTNHLK